MNVGTNLPRRHSPQSYQAHAHVASAATPLEASASCGWSRACLAGRLCEISGYGAGATLSLTFRIVHDAQIRHEPAAWIASTESSFFPPDAAAFGIDLAALAVIRLAPVPYVQLPDRSKRRTRYTSRAARAAELLIRSGAFGLIVIDLGTDAVLPMAVQARLAGLAKKHDTAILCLTEKQCEAPSIGSLVSLHLHANLKRIGRNRFRCTAEAVKDKRRGPGWTHTEVHHGPPGLH